MWPECPDEAELRAQQKSIVGVAHFVEGGCDAHSAAASDPLLGMYDCSKPVAWRADDARALPSGAAPYAKGNLQIWHVTKNGFTDACQGAELLALAARAKKPAIKAAAAKKHAGGKVKKEEEGGEEEAKSTNKRTRTAAKKHLGGKVKKEEEEEEEKEAKSMKNKRMRTNEALNRRRPGRK